MQKHKKTIPFTKAVKKMTRRGKLNKDYCELCGSSNVRFRSTTRDLKCREKGCGHLTLVKRRFA